MEKIQSSQRPLRDHTQKDDKIKAVDSDSQSDFDFDPIFDDDMLEFLNKGSLPDSQPQQAEKHKINQERFWTYVQNVADGETYPLAIRLVGILRKEKEISDSVRNPPGRVPVKATLESGGYRLIECHSDSEDEQLDVKSVYWLPWSCNSNGHNLGREFVPIKDLNDKYKDCEFFLTSNLSGCRFVATDEYLTHISHNQKSLSKDYRIGRNLAEDKLIKDNEFKPTKRLALSQSINVTRNNNEQIATISQYYSYGQKKDKPGIDLEDKDEVEEVKMVIDQEEEEKVDEFRAGGYSSGNIGGSGSAFVVGIRDGNDWTIKYLTQSEGMSQANNKWCVMKYGIKKEEISADSL